MPMGDDGDMEFFNDDVNIENGSLSEAPWKIVVVDDEPDVLRITSAVLHNCIFLQKPVVIYEARSASEARYIFSENLDIAAAIIDVVMETEDAGLKLVEFIRNELGLKSTRIILRTGQPGFAPDQDVIERYEINDYRLKTELSSNALYASIISALRGYYEVLSRAHAEEMLRDALVSARASETNARREWQRLIDFATSSSDLFWETNSEQNITFISSHSYFKDLQDNAIGSIKFNSIEQFIESDGIDIWESLLNSLYKQEIFRNIEVHTRNSAGDNRYFSFTGVPRFNDNGEYLGHRGTAMDVTERRVTELAIRDREKSDAARTVAIFEQRRFQDFAASSADWYWESDVSGCISFLFDEDHSITQSRGSVKNISCHFIRKNDVNEGAQLFWSSIESSFSNKTAFKDLEYELTLPSGSVLYLALNGVPAYDSGNQYVGFRGTARDITTRKSNEIILQESNDKIASLSKRLSQIITSSATVTYIVYPDERLRKPIFITDNISQLTGYDKQEFFENVNFWVSRVHQDDLFRFLKDFDILRNTGRHESDYRFRHRDGRWVWIRDSQTLIRNDDGIEFEVVGALSDITDHKASENTINKTNRELQRTLNDLKQTQSQLIHAEKMSALGQLVAGVAHEINNPLGFVIANLESLSELCGSLVSAYRQLLSKDQEFCELSGSSEIDETLADISELLPASLAGLDRIKIIIKHLRQFSRSDSGAPAVENIETLLSVTIGIVKKQLEDRGIKIITDIAPLPLVRCYAGELNQVFMNLIINAEQAMGPGGRITIMACECDNVYIRLEFSDTGHGISGDIIDKIFEPFFTTKPVGKGTGLGLSITYGIITKRHRGAITVISEVGKGTTFQIMLPVSFSDDEMEGNG